MIRFLLRIEVRLLIMWFALACHGHGQGMGHATPPPPPPGAKSSKCANRPIPQLEDITAKAGIDFSHASSEDKRYIFESMSGGVILFDYDRDGWPDIYLTNAPTIKMALDGKTSLGALYHNNHDGTFTDVAKKAGLDNPGLFTSAVFFDYDNNGTLDLYVGHFAKYSKSLERDCSTNGIAHYCYPKSYDPWPSRLYRNHGDGTFSDVSLASGIGNYPGKSFGVVATDVNHDGLLDLFVANDSVPNFLFLNKGGGKFDEIALQAGVAYSPDGAARSGMGVDAIDFNQDGFQDLFVANISREMYSLYRNKGDNTFDDVAGATGIAMATIMDTGWGLRFFDFDLDGWPDILIVNGHPDDLIESISSSLHYKEPLLLFRNNGHGFDDATELGGPAFTARYPARGLAVGDLDNDGRPDVVIANNGAAPVILHNVVANGNHWLGLDLRGLAVGANITWSAGGVTHSLFHRGGGSYLSACDPRDLLGLGRAEYADWIKVQWPGAVDRTDRFDHVAAGRYYSLAPGGHLK
jgi:hypothetical protein